MRVSDEILEEMADIQQKILHGYPQDEWNQMQGDVSGPQLLEIIADLRDLRSDARKVIAGWNGLVGSEGYCEFKGDDWILPYLGKFIDKLREAMGGKP